MRSLLTRLALFTAAIAVVISCDAGIPTAPGGIGGPTGSGGATGKDSVLPTVILSTPVAGAAVKVGDSILVTARGLDDRALKNLTIVGYTVTGSVALGTYKQTVRYTSIAVPAAGAFRAGLTDTTVQRYLKPALPLDTTLDSLVIRAYATDSSGNKDSASVRVNIVAPPRVTIAIDTPLVANRYYVGDSILVRAHATDDRGLKNVTVVGYAVSGSVALGTYKQTVRYPAITIPVSGTFRVGLLDTVVQRFLQPGAPVDTTVDSLIIRAYATDSSGGEDSASVRVNLIARPKAPTIVIDTPSVGTMVNVGDSIYVVARATDDRALRSVTFVGYTVTGSVDLGTYKQTVRYPAITIPISGSFRPGLTDTTVRRYLMPGTPLDSSVDSLIIRAYVVDSVGKQDSSSVRVNMVNGPRVTLIDPTSPDSESAGVRLTLKARAIQTQGVASIFFVVRSGTGWATQFTDTVGPQAYASSPQDTSYTAQWQIPTTAPLGASLTITAYARDVNRNIGQSAAATVVIKSTTALAPRVYQTVPPKMEIVDAISVTAKGDAGIKYIGYVARDSAGTLVKRDSIALPSPYSTPQTVNVPVILTTAEQGKMIGFKSFAIDSAGRIGYSILSTTTIPDTVEATAHADSALIVFGRTFKLPRFGTIADIAVDTARGDVFLSNLDNNLIEVWQHDATTAGPALGFVPNGIAVGSQPWGLFLANDTLLVANSGATTISRVMLPAPGNAPPASENLGARIRTRDSFIFTFTYSEDATTHIVHLQQGPTYSFSDRPQNIVESTGGRIFFSTKPTAFAPEGTVRWMKADPTQAAPDAKQIWQYANALPSQTAFTYDVFNADSVYIEPPDTIGGTPYILACDHPSGSAAAGTCVRGTVPDSVLGQLRATGSDVEWTINLDLKDLALTDTTYAAASGNRNWVAFGEGNLSTRTAARVFMVQDSAAADTVPQFFSPEVSVSDLMQNASEKVFGIAVDSVGRQVAAHGADTYFAAVDNPFHLRLEGMYDSFDNGAGVAFAPGAKGPVTTYASPYYQRLAFAATTGGTIQAIDVAYFINRGTFMTKANLYGPLRVTGPMRGDTNVLFKIFGLSSNGLVVIDITPQDIKAGP